MKNTAISPLTGIIIAIIVAGVAFFGGMQYQKSQSPASSGQFGQRGTGQFQRGAGGARNDGRVIGDIISSEAKSITVKMADGSTKIVILSESTSINKADKATVADLTSGTKVAIFGTANSDGSVTAQNIQLNPMMQNFVANPSPNSGK